MVGSKTWVKASRKWARNFSGKFMKRGTPRFLPLPKRKGEARRLVWAGLFPVRRKIGAADFLSNCLVDH